MARMSKIEKKFGRYAIPNLTLLLIFGYVVGYIIQLLNADFLNFLSLDPYKVLHGQIWRLLTWVLIPPTESNVIFVILMLFCCYSIGTALERAWGTYKYNVYIFGGILLTILSAFFCLGLFFILYRNGASIQGMVLSAKEILKSYPDVWFAFGTYYINVSIYLGFAMTYPENVVMLYFVLPVKMKWLGFLDLAYMIYLLCVGGLFTRMAVAAALLNCLIFYLINLRSLKITSTKQLKRRAMYQQSMREAQDQREDGHKCTICGQTDKSNPTLEFRFCSKCNGMHEYCQEHLFSHQHIR